MQKKHCTKSNTLEHGNTHPMRAGVICKEHIAFGDGRTKAFPFRSGASRGQRLSRRPCHPELELLPGEVGNEARAILAGKQKRNYVYSQGT